MEFIQQIKRKNKNFIIVKLCIFCIYCICIILCVCLTRSLLRRSGTCSLVQRPGTYSLFAFGSSADGHESLRGGATNDSGCSKQQTCSGSSNQRTCSGSSNRYNIQNMQIYQNYKIYKIYKI